MKKLNQTLLLFPMHKWEYKYEASIKFLAREFIKENDIVYINAPYTIKDILLNYKELIKTGKFKKLLPFSNGIEEFEMPDGKIVTVLNPPVLFSINSLPEGKIYKIFHKINHSLIASRVNKFLKKRKIHDYIFINSFNFLYESLDKFLKPKLNVYNCVDELVKPVSIKHGRRQENEIISRADLVIVTSEALVAKKSKLNPNCKLVTNAADVAHFSQALKPYTLENDKVKALSKPIIGYVGVIERRFDFELIYSIAKKHPEWTFALIGSVQKQYMKDGFDELENIHLLGYLPYYQLPNALKTIDVAIIPFVKDEVSNTIYPLKINEYLGAGKPIVSTTFNPALLDEFSDLVYFAADEDDFVKGIKENLNNMSEDVIEKRTTKAAENSWTKRAEEFIEMLDNEVKKSK